MALADVELGQAVGAGQGLAAVDWILNNLARNARGESVVARSAQRRVGDINMVAFEAHTANGPRFAGCAMWHIKEARGAAAVEL